MGLIANQVQGFKKAVPTIMVIISVLWAFGYGLWAIVTFIELIIGCSFATEMKQNTNSNVKPSATNQTTFEPSDFDYQNYLNGHTIDNWKKIGLKVESKYVSVHKKYYTFKEVEPSTSLKYMHLSPNQRKVKILGGALVKKTRSKKIARDILIRQYTFKKSTAEYAVGYEGYYDW